jgi:Fe-S-cluster-containing hydrogenase component 2
MKRNIIEIDRETCTGCALCTTACAEGALVMDKENKAVLAKEIFCDGLGACLDVCPSGALKIIEREAPAFDEAAATAQAGKPIVQPQPPAHEHSGCPGSALRSFVPQAGRAPGAPLASPVQKAQAQAEPCLTAEPSLAAEPCLTASELAQWPIQLHLISPNAPYFEGCDLLIAADCTAFALGSFHQGLLKGKKLAIACPKLDDAQGYREKLTELIRENTVYSITAAIMEVPCCRGLKKLVEEAVAASGKNIAVRTVVVGIDGGLS